MAETEDREMEEEEEAEAERKANAADLKEIRDLAARLEKARKELLRKKEEERVRNEAEALELQRMKREEERKLKLKQEEKRILKAKQKEKAYLRLIQERKEKEAREEQERLSKLEEAAAKANTEEISISEPSHSPCEAQDRLSLLVKQDVQLEDGRDEDTETSKSMDDGKDKSKDDLPIVEKSMTIHVEDNATTSRDSAISLLQEQEDGLTSVQKIAMIFCFMEDVVAAKTYILLTDPEVRQGWILKMLKKCPM